MDDSVRLQVAQITLPHAARQSVAVQEHERPADLFSNDGVDLIPPRVQLGQDERVLGGKGRGALLRLCSRVTDKKW